jgi:tellurium resistance protein TerD
MSDTHSVQGVQGQRKMLQKGDEVILNDIDPGLHKAHIGVGWNAPAEADGFPVDIDLSAFLLRHEGRVRRDTDFVFYNNLEAENGSVRHTGDNTTGDGDGDDEVIEVDLEGIAYEVDRIAFCVTIHNAEDRHQTFSLVKDAFIRIVNKDTGIEIAHFDLSEDGGDDNGIIFGELTRDGDKWKFSALGQGSSGGLYKIAREYGVNVAAP